MHAVVTGGASGIGLATARRLIEQGADVLLLDVDSEALSKAAGQMESGGSIHTFEIDLTSPEAGAEVEAAVRRSLGSIDALVSNAGVLRPAPLDALTLDDYELAFAVNTRPTWLLAKALHPLLKASAGCIVATASLAGEEPAPFSGAYSASKAALIMLVKQMAYEWGPDGIRCNCVSPGTVDTPMNRIYKNAEAREERSFIIPLRRVAEPEDIADAIVFLTSSAASYISGINLVVDGALRTTLMSATRFT